MISPINTPVRFYSDLFESDRFSNDCDIERFELISDKTRLLPFQFKRPKSPYPINRWFLRKQCENQMNPLVDTNNSLFNLDTGYWSKTNFSFVNGKLKSSGTTAQLDRLFIFTDTEFYKVKIVVNDLSVAGSFSINAVTGFRTIATITGTGTYYLQFQANALDEDFSLVCSFGNVNDYISIEEIQIFEFQAFDVGIGDIDLPLNLIDLVNINTTEDLIRYCGSDLPFQIPCGKYYIIITYGLETIIYSELITVKDFIPSQSPFTLIEWYNSCDIGDIIYQAINGCSYKNRLYIHSELSKPTYPFTEEAEEDGNFKLNIVFQKWEKQSSLIFAKSPEFIVDALTGIRLHDTFFVTKSLRLQQFQVLDPIEVERVEYEIDSVFNDCATNVNLILTLKDKVIDSTCCENEEIIFCLECGYTVDALDVLTGEYYFGTYLGNFSLFHVVEGVYTDIQQDGQIVCVTDDNTKWLNYNEEYWTAVPLINTVNDTSLGGGNYSYQISGYTYSNTFVKITVTIYDAATDTTTVQILDTIYTSEELYSGITILSTSFNESVPENGTVSFQFENYTLNCNYGNSNVSEVSYISLHPIVKNWYDGLDIQPNNTTIWAINNFIQGIDDDGFINEFDLLHIIAGLDTDNQRLIPLISTSGNIFVPNGTYTLDFNGYSGDATTAFLNLQWTPSTNGAKYLQDNASLGFYSSSDAAGLYTDIGLQDAGTITAIRSRISTNQFTGRLNGATLLTASNGDSIGLFSLSRNGSLTIAYKDGVSVNSATYSSTAVQTNEIYLGAYHNGISIAEHSPRNYQLVFIGSDAINQSILFNRFTTLKTALGF